MKTLPVQKHFLIFERVVSDDAAKAAWRAFIEAHGWTMVGDESDIEIRKVPEGWAVLGLLIRTDETLPVKIRHDAGQVRLP